jgi:WD40 repeat protein
MPQIAGSTIMRTWLARTLVLVGFGWTEAAVVAAAGQDLHGDPLPEGAVARLGSVRFRSPDGEVSGLHFSGDGKTLLTVGGNAALRVWETSTGRLLREVRPEPVYVRAVVFPPDGKQIALEGGRRIGGDTPGSEEVRRLVDVTSGKEVRRFKMAERDGDQVLAATPDFKYLLSLGHLGVLRIEEMSTGTEVLEQKFPRDNSARLAVSPDGKTTAVWTGPNTRKLYLWEWQEGGEPRELKVPRYGIHQLTFSPDGKSLAACGGYEPYVYEWDVATGRLRHEVALRDDITPFGLALHPDGKTMAVSDYGGRKGKHFSGGVLHLERGTGKVVRELPTPGAAACQVVFSLDGRWLAATAGGASGARFHVWDLRSGEEVAAGAAGHQGAIAQIATAPGGLIATAGDDHTVRLWDAATGKERRRLQHGGWVRAVALSPDGRRLASSSLDDTVRLWDTQSGKELSKLPGHGQVGGYRAVGFRAGGARLLSWGDDLDLRVWDIKTGKRVAEYAVRPPGLAKEDEEKPAARERRMERMMMGPAAFAPDGQHLVAPLSGSFLIIDTATGRIEQSVPHPGGHVISSIAVAPDGRHFATSGWARAVQRKLPDGRIQIATPDEHPVCLFELATGKLVRELKMPSSAAGPVAFSADGKLLAVGFGRDSGEVRVLDAASLEPVATLAGFGSGPHAMDFSPDGKYLITGLNDGTALVWDMDRVATRKEE